MPNISVTLAPLQGYTDWVFRKVYSTYFSSIDQYYTPFLVLQNKVTLKTAHQREVATFSPDLTPQILCGSSDEMQFFEQYLTDLGYSEMNWNMGCPYPMVTRRGKGSGLLPYPEKVVEILEKGYSGKIKLSVKMRLGLETANEINAILPILQTHHISEIILHPRIAKQLYKGNPNQQAFANIYRASSQKITYNGDIFTVADFKKLQLLVPEIDRIMLGRGILTDYWLPEKIKGFAIPNTEERTVILEQFHASIFQTYSSFLSGETQLLQKLKPFWEYFSYHFNNQRKVFKQIKKASNISKYHTAVAFAFQQGVI